MASSSQGGGVWIPYPTYPTLGILYPLDTPPQIPYPQDILPPDTQPPGYPTLWIPCPALPPPPRRNMRTRDTLPPLWIDKHL